MHKKFLIAILVSGAVVRFAGIQFGLPLWLVGDEPSLIFGALKMLELRTLLPALHTAEFSGILYYTPYIPYLYLPSFVAAIAVKWFAFAGDFASFANYLKTEIGIFFILARGYSAVFGLATVWLVYAAALHYFKNVKAALFAALFMAFGFLPVGYSHFARHWTPVTAIFALVLYVLCRSDWSVKKRYFLIALAASVGIGVNLQVSFALIFVFLWMLFVDKLPVFQTLKQKWFWSAAIIFGLGCGVAYAIWPNGFGFLSLLGNSGSVADSGKTVMDFFASYWFYISDFIKAEPLALLFFLVGSAVLWKRDRAFASIVWLFIAFYIAIFFFVFTELDRFILPLYPFIAFIAGYGLTAGYEKIHKKNSRAAVIFVTVIACALIIPVVRFNYLLIKNDTRVQAIDWLEKNTSPDEKIAILVPLMRVPATTAAIDRLSQIDPNALRTIDRAERYSPPKEGDRRFDALNAYTINNPEWFETMQEYLIKNDFDYLVIDESYARSSGADFDLSEIGDTIKFFEGSVSSLDDGPATGHQTIPDGYGDGLRELFLSPSFGPDITIVRSRFSSG